MPRSIITKKDIPAEQAAPDEASALIVERTAPVSAQDDGYFDRLLKYVPTEVVTIYISAIGLSAYVGSPSWLLWTIYAICQIATPIFLRHAGVRQFKHHLISFLSFFAWAVVYGGPFTSITWMQNGTSSILLLFYTFVAPCFTPGEDMLEEMAAETETPAVEE